MPAGLDGDLPVAGAGAGRTAGVAAAGAAVSVAGAAGLAATSGVGAGSHTVAVWFSAFDGVNTVYDSNAGANYTANFQTAIPEPATMGLLASARWSWRCAAVRA